MGLKMVSRAGFISFKAGTKNFTFSLWWSPAKHESDSGRTAGLYYPGKDGRRGDWLYLYKVITLASLRHEYRITIPVLIDSYRDWCMIFSMRNKIETDHRRNWSMFGKSRWKQTKGNRIGQDGVIRRKKERKKVLLRKRIHIHPTLPWIKRCECVGIHHRTNAHNFATAIAEPCRFQ